MQINIYRVSKLNLIFKFLFLIILITIFVCILYATKSALSGFSNGNIKLGCIGIGFTFLSLYVSYYFGTFIKMFLQYLSNDFKREIIVDYKNDKLIIKDAENAKSKIFTTENLKVIEFNLSSKSSKNLLSEYEFIKLITINNEEYFITNLILNSSDIISFLPTVKKTTKFNRINYLK
jgi:hypothetical protein